MKNGPWRRKNVWFLYKAKVNVSPYVYSDSTEPTQSASTTPTKGSDDESDNTDVEELPETDGDRRQTMMTSMDASEANLLRTGSLIDFWGDFILPKCSTEGHSTGSKETGDDGPPPRITLQRAGNTSSVTSGTSAPVRTRADPTSSKFTPAQEESQHEREGFRTITIKEDRQTMWSCLVCTL